MMTDDELNRLKGIATPSPDVAAKRRAMNAAMAAFDAAEEEKSKKNTTSTQGSAGGGRLMSIFNVFKGRSIMDIRIPLGAAAIGLLLFPLALHLNSTTGLTGFGNAPNMPTVVSKSAPEAVKIEQPEEDGVADLNVLPMAEGETSLDVLVAPEPTSMALTRDARSAPSVVGQLAAPMQEEIAMGAPAPEAGYMHKRTEPMPVPAESSDQFSQYDDAPVFVTADTPVSTFSIDVDTASYTYLRRSLEAGVVPPREAIRVEEMLNYFDYDYPAPESGAVPFSQTVEVYPTPWNTGTKLLHIGIKGFEPALEERKPINLVFLIDSSGSMQDVDKLPLLKRSFALLLDQMDADDTISIVTYAGSAGTVLSPTPATEKAKILLALERLEAGGSTAGAAGIEEAYRLAETAKSADSVNRVILATDGDFNVGVSNPDDLKTLISKKRESGVSLSVLGFGAGNYNDALMQALAQNGNGNAYYIDSYKEARKVLAEEVQGTLTTIAKDVKIQVEFNPATVMEYRLVGYETRALRREDFNNDRVDAGEIGAGHTVTAIYEITPVGSDGGQTDPLRYGTPQTLPEAGNADEYAFLRLRYKLPDGSISKLIEQPVRVADAVQSIDVVPADFRFGAAVAAFGQKLKGGIQADAMSYADIHALAADAKGKDTSGYRSEFLSLVDIAGSLESEVR